MEKKIETRIWRSEFWMEKVEMPYWKFVSNLVFVGILGILIASLAGCGMSGDPVPDDIYSKNIYPGTTALYALGSSGLQFKDVYTERINGGLAPGTFYDFDGDGKYDPVVYRSSNDTVYIYYSSGVGSGYEYYQYFGDSDRFFLADYNGDGKTELGLYRPTNNAWMWVENSPSGGDMGSNTWTTIYWGSSGDVGVYNGAWIHGVW